MQDGLWYYNQISLKKYGFCKDDITDVIHTHLHFDHCGGAIEKINEQLVPAFKNANFWSNELHWQTATKPNAREKASFLKENILPIEDSGQLKLIEVSGSFEGKLGKTSFSQNIDVRFAGGHTEAMMLPQIKYKGKTIVYMADLLPSAGHIPIPYVMAYDMFPLKTLQEKKSFLKEAVDNDYILFFEHDRENECCTLEQTEKGIRPKEFFKLADI